MMKRKFTQWLSQVFTRLRLWELRRVVKKKKFSLLDLGCGKGELVRLANKQGIKAQGADELTGQTIERLRSKQRFEVVSLYHVLEHVDDPELVLRKIKQWLRPGGWLVIEVPLVGSLTEKWLGKEYFIYHDPSHRHFFSQPELKGLLDQTGWQVKKQGLTWYQFPLTVITSGFRRGWVRGIAGLVLWLPLKLLSMLGLNSEMVRWYCGLTNES